MDAPPMSDQMSALLHRLTRLANEAEELPVVLASAVADICVSFGWPAGLARLDDVDGIVGGTARGAQVPVMEDLLVRSRETGQVQWSSDGAGTGTATVVVPILTGAGPSGELWFTATAIDPTVGQLLGTVGWQLGMVAQREHDRAELERREDALERSNLELERFAYVASHDLQEPLRKVVTACELLVKRHGDELPDDAIRYVDIAVDGAQRMQQLIRDLLTYSRVTRGDAEETGEADLAAVVEEVLGELSMQLEEADAVVEVSDLPVVAMGPNEARQVVANLLSNAIKYRGDAAPEVRIAARDHQDGMVELVVCDNGIGIDPQYHQQIFDVFRRLHRRDEYSGTGIGLAIVKRIVEHHDGRVWLTDAPGSGTCFHVLLPGGDRT